MAASTPRGISYPTPDDKIKDGTSPSALADDFMGTATSADAAITAGVQEAKDAASADASAKDAAIDAKATSAVSTANNALAVSSGASADADNAVDRVTALESAAGFGPSTPTDGTMADYIANPTSLTAGALSAAIVEQAAATDGISRVMKPAGDMRAGVLDWRWDNDYGYLLHFQAGENTTAASAAFGIGTDHGSGSAGVLALKNGGNGLQIGSHPSHTGKAFTLSSYGKDAVPCEVSLFSGAKPLIVTHKLGQGFSDGATTNGSTTLTSATANFTSADVGATLTQTTSRGEGFGAIPAGATIASVTNATTVEMSVASTRTATGINFLVGGRAVPSAQEFLSFYNSADERVISLAPAVTVFNTRAEFIATTSPTADSTYFNGASAKFYTHNGTNYSAHEIKADAFAWRLRHYAAAGKGQEASPVQSLIATVSGGAPRMGFFGAGAQAKPTVTGSRTDGTALASLLSALATLGLVTDSTTA